MLIPSIDPLRANIRRFRAAYDWFVVFFASFMLYLYIITLLWNTGSHFDFLQLLVPAVAGLYFLVGILVEKAQRNYLIGIRTPWTLNNGEVWNRTHKIGGLVFKIAAIFTLPGIFWPTLAVWFLLAPILLATVVLILISYVIYRRVTSVEA